MSYSWDGGLKSIRIVRVITGAEEQDEAWRRRVSVEADRIVRRLVAREGFIRAHGTFPIDFLGYEEPYLPWTNWSVADPNIIIDPDQTPLMKAVAARDITTVSDMIRKDINVNAQDQKGWTALMIASAEYQSAIVKLLLDSGAEVNVKNRDGETPLILAAGCGDVKTIRMLIAAGADLNARTNNGHSALNYAAYSSETRDRIIRMLRQAGARW